MNIGIDIDGVLTKLEDYMDLKGKEHFGFDVVNKTEYEVRDRFAVSRNLGNEFWTEHIKEYIQICKAREDASSITNKLHQEGNKITIITARGYNEHYKNKITEEEVFSLTKAWLKENNIYYDDIIFAKDPKIKEVKKCDLDYMIEDSPRNINELSEFTKVIIYNTDYNLHIQGNNIAHAKNWQEIYQIITGKELN